ncbi:MAG: AIM24 family protein [Gemmatirosa sp.]
MTSPTSPSADPTALPYRVAESITRGGTTFELLEYAALAGSESFAVAEQCFTLNRAGVRLRQLRVRLSSDAVRTEPGALQFLRGRIEMESNTGAGEGFGGLLKGALAAARTGETLFKPLYRGSGELYLEPTFGHFWLRELQDETLYADQGLFFCCEDSVKVEAHKVESFSARMAGGEGRYQTKVSGTGLVVFRIPVPRAEIIELTLADETLQVDGSFALLRTADVHFGVEKASNSYVGAVTSGEGLLQTFRGTGRVWIAPTQPLYEKMGAGLKAGAGAKA